MVSGMIHDIQVHSKALCPHGRGCRIGCAPAVCHGEVFHGSDAPLINVTILQKSRNGV